MREATDPLAATCSDVIDPPLSGIAREDTTRFGRRSTAAAVAEAPRDFRFTYSLRDIHRIAFLTADERQEGAIEWKAWHRRNASMGSIGVALWSAAAAAAWACWFRAGGTAATLADLAGLQVPLAAVYAVAGVLTLGLLVAAPLLFSTLARAALGDAYLAGYADGIVAGVNRSLQITPEREQEMWGQLHDAEARDLRAVRAVSSTAVAPGPVPESVSPRGALR